MGLKKPPGLHGLPTEFYLTFKKIEKVLFILFWDVANMKRFVVHFIKPA